MFAASPVPKTFFTVQYVRGACAMAVVLWHGLSQLLRFQPHLTYPGWGAIAVDIFFVISGFVMWHMMMMQPVSFGEYCRKRFVRAIPFYWAMTSFVVAVMLLAPRLLSTSRFDFAHVVASYFFVPWLHPVLRGEFAPVIIPGWTLDFEIAFYLVLGFGLFVPLRWRALAVVAAILAAALSPAVIAIHSPILVFYTQPLIVNFASGILLGWLVWNGFRLPAAAALALIAVALGSIVLMPSPSHFVPELGGYRFMLAQALEYCGPALAIVGGAVFLDAARTRATPWRLPALIGDAAYSIYIVQVFVLAALTRAWSMTGLQTDWRWNAVHLTSAVFASTAAGIACHFALELPLYRLFDRITRRKLPAARTLDVGVTTAQFANR